MPKSSHHHCSPTPTPTFFQSAPVSPALVNSSIIHPVTQPRKRIHPKSFCPLLPHLIQSPSSLPPKHFPLPLPPLTVAASVKMIIISSKKYISVSALAPLNLFSTHHLKSSMAQPSFRTWLSLALKGQDPENSTPRKVSLSIHFLFSTSYILISGIQQFLVPCT